MAALKKCATARDAFLHAAVLGDSRSLNHPRDRAKVLDALAQMDAAHVADFYGRNPVNRCLGRDYHGVPLASAAVFSKPGGSVTQLNQRSWTFAR